MDSAKEIPLGDSLERALESLQNIWDVVSINKNSNPFSNTGGYFKCSTFEVAAYSWIDDAVQPYNFKWKDLEVSWYKSLGRGSTMNRLYSEDEIIQLALECTSALFSTKCINEEI